MSQLTLRGLDPELERRVRELAEREGLSMNQAALRLLRKGAGLVRGEELPAERIGAALDRWIGTWTDEDVRELEEATRDLEQIDESLWK